MGASRQLIRRALAGLLPSSRFLVHGPREQRELALTFDDGPHPEITPRLLDLLASLRIPATFFLIGREAERHPDLVSRMVAEGHAVGHHSWTHSEPATTGARDLLDEVTRCRTLLRGIVSREVNLFRPPKGQLNAAKLFGLLAAGQRIVLWSADPKDYAMTDAAPLCRWAAEAPLGPGDVVLLHDVRSHCLAALPDLASRAERTGLRFVPVTAWLPA